MLTAGDRLPAATAGALESLSITATYICGGPAAVNEAVFMQLPNPQHIYGADRYKTALALAAEFLSPETEQLGLATGLDFPAALTGGAWAARYNSGIILIDGTARKPCPAVQGFLTDRANTGITIFGGPDAVNSCIESWLQANLANKGEN